MRETFRAELKRIALVLCSGLKALKESLDEVTLDLGSVSGLRSGFDLWSEFRLKL